MKLPSSRLRKFRPAQPSFPACLGQPLGVLLLSRVFRHILTLRPFDARSRLPRRRANYRVMGRLSTLCRPPPATSGAGLLLLWCRMLPGAGSCPAEHRQLVRPPSSAAASARDRASGCRPGAGRTISGCARPRRGTPPDRVAVGPRRPDFLGRVLAAEYDGADLHGGHRPGERRRNGTGISAEPERFSRYQGENVKC